MIKVEHTKTHIVDIPNGTASGKHTLHENVLVTEAKLVLVECKPEEALLWWDLKEGFAIYNKNLHGSFQNKAISFCYYKPILIFETEKIENGDWVYNEISKEIYQFKENHVLYEKKILALPEHFSSKHLQDIVDGKLKDGDKVLVGCEHKYHTGENWVNQIKLNPHITIYPVEEKMYTKEEVKNILVQFAIDCDANDDLICYEGHNEKGERQYNELKKWFEQNVK